MTTDGYVVIRHPVTGRFICKIDFVRDIMYVVDRNKEAIIDLSQTRTSENGRVRETDTGGLFITGIERGQDK